MAGATAMYIAIGIFGGLALDASIQGKNENKCVFPPFFNAAPCALTIALLPLVPPAPPGDDGSELLAVLTQSPRIHVFTKVMTYIL